MTRLCDAIQTTPGRFLLERLGAERYVDPKLMATLWQLRQALLDEGGAWTAAEAMLVDLTVLSYAHALRVQGWIGDLALFIEHEFFGQESPTAKFGKTYGRVEGFRVEDRLHRMTEQLMPLLDRANRMVIRNLKAIKELRHGRAPTVAIGQAAQVNVANQQANAVVPSASKRTRHGTRRPARARG